MQTIRYHPLVDMDSDGTEKVPLFMSTEESMIRQSHKLYLSEVVPSYYRLHSTEPMSTQSSARLAIHCPMCGKALRQIAANVNNYKHGLYTCDRCSHN